METIKRPDLFEKLKEVILNPKAKIPNDEYLVLEKDDDKSLSIAIYEPACKCDSCEGNDECCLMRHQTIFQVIKITEEGVIYCPQGHTKEDAIEVFEFLVEESLKKENNYEYNF